MECCDKLDKKRQGIQEEREEIRLPERSSSFFPSKRCKMQY